MADVGVFAKSADIQARSGIYANATAKAVAATDIYILNIEFYAIFGVLLTDYNFNYNFIVEIDLLKYIKIAIYLSQFAKESNNKTHLQI